MTKIEKIQSLYKSERAELLKKYKSGEVKKADYEDFLQQLNNVENIDIMDAILEGEE
tara:strand:- start:294 stop:464 length:171 start_codon:yes stop_codon:yes gene_type:complete